MHSESQVFKKCVITPEVINKIESYRKTININLTLDEALEKQKTRSKKHPCCKSLHKFRVQPSMNPAYAALSSTSHK